MHFKVKYAHLIEATEADKGIFRVSQFEYHRLRRRARVAKRNSYREVCGLAVINVSQKKRKKSTGGISPIGFVFMRNETKQCGEFLLQRSDVMRLAKRLREQGQEVIGTFHSHPLTFAIPGKRDVHEAFFKGHLLIYDVIGDSLRMWKKMRKHNGRWRIREVKLRLPI